MVGGSLNNHLQNYKVQGHHIRQLQEHPTSRWRPKTRSTKLTASRAVAAPAMSAISWIRPFYWILGNWGTYQDNAPSAFKSAITSSSGFAVSSYLDLLEGPYNLTVSYLILQVLHPSYHLSLLNYATTTTEPLHTFVLVPDTTPRNRASNFVRRTVHLAHFPGHTDHPQLLPRSSTALYRCAALRTVLLHDFIFLYIFSSSLTHVSTTGTT